MTENLQALILNGKNTEEGLIKLKNKIASLDAGGSRNKTMNDFSLPSLVIELSYYAVFIPSFL